MPGHYTKEELDRLDKQALIMLLMSMQDQFQQMNDSLNRLTEQIAAANQYRFGRHSEKMDDFKGQLSIFDLLCILSTGNPQKGVRTKSWTTIVAKEETAHVFS